MEKIMSALESVLFVSGEPLKLGQLVKVLGLDVAEVEKGLAALREKYASGQSGLMLARKGDEAQLVSRPENAEFVEQLTKSQLQENLSTVAMEVLSIIAYRGPISKPEIEAIRGVNCNYTLRNLLLRGLIEKSDNPRDSRGFVYHIAFEFLKKMGLEGVEKMPNYATLSVDGRINSAVGENL